MSSESQSDDIIQDHKNNTMPELTKKTQSTRDHQPSSKLRHSSTFPVEYDQDKLISSISVISEVLQSNM
jgi:hypothetical protein